SYGAIALSLGFARLAFAGDAPSLEALITKWKGARENSRYVEAEEIGKRMVDLVERTQRDHLFNLAWCLDALACSYCDQSKYEDAEPVYARLVRVLDRLPDADNTAVGNCLTSVALFYESRGKISDAQRLYERALR